MNEKNKIYIPVIILIQLSSFSVFCLFCVSKILAVNGITLLNLSYEEALKLLQNTGKTVELVVSQIFYRSNGTTDVNNKQNSYQNVDANNEHRRNSQIDKRFMNYENTRENNAKIRNFEQQTYRNCTPKDVDDSNDRHTKHKRDTNNRLLSAKSLPDLPKVCIAFYFYRK